MNVNQFECFVSLAQYLNFTKASRAMHITQPAFSRYISNLEDELGIILFYRNKRSVELTEAGKVFLEEVKKMLHHLNNGIINAKQVQNRKSQTLKVGFIGPFASYFLPKLLTNIRNTHPNVGLKISEYSHSNLIESIRNNEVDVAFTASFQLESIADITWKTIYEDCYNVVLHREHPLACNDTVNLKDLSREPCIFMNSKEWSQGYKRVENICLKHGFSPIVVSEEQYITSVMTLVECRVGYAILPKVFQILASPELRFIKIEKFNEVSEEVIAWKKNNSNPCIPIFIDEVEKMIPYIRQVYDNLP
ncbi:LysR family transcriptional regulator [Clostridium sp. PL3]|uniref:LysR family transcriptional regulator n=1 Tax=Clostridium thailandense TaxID=2794346 RepID=A0A949U2V7_9CLOT|nr:LysR family transcriptional regulator [Clostridium thailandense]MBV7276430.1 LysR family transcriptional regulator [Clostridium thailandense]